MDCALITHVSLNIAAMSNIWSCFYLSKRRSNWWVLLQFKKLADEVLFCKTQGLQFTEHLLKYLQKRRWAPHNFSTRSNRWADTMSLDLAYWQCHLVKLGPVGHVKVRGRHVAHVQQWGRLRTPTVGALHCQLVQAWSRTGQLARAAMKACHGTRNTSAQSLAFYLSNQVGPIEIGDLFFKGDDSSDTVTLLQLTKRMTKRLQIQNQSYIQFMFCDHRPE